ncbi:hypothetical protein SAMN02910292_02567 [Lachnospiraceae bacterium XBB2008]|nr:hypothetical protein SAMN02910292_02567 [Lachnospiraceae bacterium XBB2008]
MNEMDSSIQDILKIRYLRSFYDPSGIFEGRVPVYCCTDVYELSADGICTYYREKDSRKQQDKVYTKVDSDVMRSFMNNLIEYAHAATETYRIVDDCSHEVQFIYYGEHKEIFQMDVGTGTDGDDSLISRIERFVSEHRHQQRDIVFRE